MIISLFIYIFLTCSNTSLSHQGTQLDLGLPSLQWWTLTGGRMQCYRLFCYKTIFPPSPPSNSAWPCEQVLTLFGTGLRQGLPSLLHDRPFFLPPCHLAVIPQPCLLPPSLALTYIVPYLCCKYNIKLSREPLVCLMLHYTDLHIPLTTLLGIHRAFVSISLFTLPLLRTEGAGILSLLFI